MAIGQVRRKVNMPIIILGHRGVGPTSRVYVNQSLPEYVLPENSLIAFQTAINNGAQGIELDVYATKDGTVVVSREDILDRNVDGYHSSWTANDIPVLGRISEKTAAELHEKKYSLGHDQFIPRLIDVIDLIISNNKKLNSSNLKLNIELQGDNLLVADYTWSIIRDYVLDQENHLALTDFVINSFNIKQLIQFREAQNNNPLGNNYDVELMLGVYTSPMFGKEELLPGWVPVLLSEGKPKLDDHGLPILKAGVDEGYVQSLIELVKQYKISYLDIISSDLRANLVQTCGQNQINLSMAFNSIRSRTEYELWNDTFITDAELEQIQLQRLYIFAKQYPNQTFYYKADNVQQTLGFLNQLDRSYNNNADRVLAFSQTAPISHRVAKNETMYRLVRRTRSN